MQDNFNMHEWRLNQTLKEMEEATFTSKHDDNPKLKGGQKELPDELQAGILKKEGLSKDEMKQKCTRIARIKHEGRFPSTKATQDIMACIAGKLWAKEIEAEERRKKLKEGMDHEVSMAQNSLQSIISSASQLMNKLGNNERNIPGWIQDHITNAENYIDQANQGFHELEPKEELQEISRLDNRLGKINHLLDLLDNLKSNTATNSTIPTTSKQDLLFTFQELIDVAEDLFIDIEKDYEVDENFINQAAQGFIAENVNENKKKKAKNALSTHLKAAIEDGNKEGVEEIKKAKTKIDNAKSVDELVNILDDFGFDSDEISKILGK
jgi:hypothetical protein